MVIAKQFHDWSENPSSEAKRIKRGSPALMHIRDHHLRRWGGISLSSPSLYDFRLLKSGRPSAHAGCAVDLRWDQPGPGRQVAVNEMLPFYIQNSEELHIQAIHDYQGCRVWRANRSDDAAGGWKTQAVGSHDGKMGADWARWFHLEVSAAGWGDDRSVEEMLGSPPSVSVTGGDDDEFVPQGIITDLKAGLFGLWPFNRDKPVTKRGDRGDIVLYAQCVIFFHAGGAIATDSDFGEQTVTRVMDLQRFFGLAVQDGQIDSTTWETLDFLTTD